MVVVIIITHIQWFVDVIVSKIPLNDGSLTNGVSRHCSG
jgi:hypothetical protein